MWVIFSKSFDTFLFTFGWWRNFGTILFVQQNSWQFWKVEAFWICFICTQNSIHFLMLEEFWIYFICTNQYWGPIFQKMNLFYLYWHFQSQLIILGILWEYILMFIFFYFIFFIFYFFINYFLYILFFHILFSYILFFIFYLFIFYFIFLYFIFLYLIFLYFIFLYFIFYILCFYINLVEINMELMFLSRFWGNFVSMKGRKEGRENFNP